LLADWQSPTCGLDPRRHGLSWISLPLLGISRHGWTCNWLDLVANAPQRKSHLLLRCHATLALPVDGGEGWSRRKIRRLMAHAAQHATPGPAWPRLWRLLLADWPCNLCLRPDGHCTRNQGANSGQITTATVRTVTIRTVLTTSVTKMRRSNMPKKVGRRCAVIRTALPTYILALLRRGFFIWLGRLALLTR
jgi:hypothetical protein